MLTASTAPMSPNYFLLMAILALAVIIMSLEPMISILRAKKQQGAAVVVDWERLAQARSIEEYFELLKAAQRRLTPRSSLDRMMQPCVLYSSRASQAVQLIIPRAPQEAAPAA